MGSFSSKQNRNRTTPTTMPQITQTVVKPVTICDKCNKKGQEFHTYSRDGTHTIPMYYCKSCGHTWKV
jgi:DNA-directed RNA polymerase subunit M/transcription elongation factor TFIIS